MLIAYSVYENRSIKMLSSVKKVSLETLNDINFENSHLEENIKKYNQTGEIKTVVEFKTENNPKIMKIP